MNSTVLALLLLSSLNALPDRTTLRDQEPASAARPAMVMPAGGQRIARDGRPAGDKADARKTRLTLRADKRVELASLQGTAGR
ncbi:MAG: hypothetical protein MUC79_13280 [Thiobacillaceae bacterium]|nr:hypothetical protein [Thiobacillaceae bacterium]